MKRTACSNWIGICGVLAIAWHLSANSASAQSTGHAQSAVAAKLFHLRLVDRLDRPRDSYCVDVLGTPGSLRPDLPLFAHNCKPRLTDDSAVALDSEGRIRFVALNLCITVAGVNSRALPGTAVLLRKCDEATPFLEAAQLQRFSHHKDERLELAGSGLCLAVGGRSATTYSPADRWRPLFVDSCQAAKPARSRWEFVNPRDQ